MPIPEKVLAGLDELYCRRTKGASGGRTFSVRIRSGDDIKSLRCNRLKMSQSQFALQFGIPIRTLQKWEQNERQPEGPARAYLAVIERIPEAVIAALKSECDEGVSEQSPV